MGAYYKFSSQDRSYFQHLPAPRGPSMRIAGQAEASDIATTCAHPPNGKEKYVVLLTVHYKSGETTFRFDNYLYTEETAYRFSDACLGFDDALGDKEVARLVKEPLTSGPVNSATLTRRSPSCLDPYRRRRRVRGLISHLRSAQSSYP
jgi:hypothetical protein